MAGRAVMRSFARARVLQCLTLLALQLLATHSISQNQDVKLPPFPKPEGLIAFTPGVEGDNRYFLDPSSITSVGDGEFRFTLVVVGKSGARNVSFQGVHCKDVEHTFYAFGRSDGTWSAPRAPDWQHIESRERTLRRSLYWDFFCPDRSYNSSIKEIVARFKRGTLRPEID